MADDKSYNPWANQGPGSVRDDDGRVLPAVTTHPAPPPPAPTPSTTGNKK